jgi:PAS domain S-box-containing protein
MLVFEKEEAEWSHTLSFASPDSDFSQGSSTLFSFDTRQSREPEWSHTLSFASAESDLVAPTMVEQELSTATTGPVWSNKLSYCSPEADFTAAKAGLYDYGTSSNNYNESTQDENAAYAFSFASPEADFTSSHVYNMMDDRMKAQLKHSEGQLLHTTSEDKVMAYDSRREVMVATEHIRSIQDMVATTAALQDMKQKAREQSTIEKENNNNTNKAPPLPTSLEEAMNRANEAMVVTTTHDPFRIVDVNDAWVGLCGFSRQEARGRTLGELIQGPDTDEAQIAKTMTQLFGLRQEGGETSTILTNYSKSGRKFHNHLRIGPMIQDGEVEYFVGHLKEVHELQDHFPKQMHS